MTKSNLTLTFLDAGVLFVGRRGSPAQARTVAALISDPARIFVASNYLVMEVLPKAVYFKHQVEQKFYKEFFDAVSVWQEPATTDAYQTACRYGLAALDALHLQAALDAGADELITTERGTKPLYRARGLSVVDFSTL